MTHEVPCRPSTAEDTRQMLAEELERKREALRERFPTLADAGFVRWRGAEDDDEGEDDES